ncbi:hypothetical protein BYT27DRAFT_7193074 [Phlegmacium glaucopus]|nr:hypothetical protein BYT27DRAFT_7193074 [Phlegmacium glaucopus]
MEHNSITSMTHPRPSQRVIDAFGAVPPLEPVSGGRGTTFRAGDIILKRLDMTPEALQWQAEVLTPLTGRDDLRLSAPRKTRDGELIVDEWTAWNRLEGATEPRRWDDIIRAGEHFCDYVKDVARPQYLDGRQDPWGIADRVAWGEQAVEKGIRAAPFLNELLAILESIPAPSEPCQIIHGDLTGNTLFHPGKSPAVIDISPYWRPRSFATAIVVVDALACENAPMEWARGHLVTDTQRQVFTRALMFRIVSDHLSTAGDDYTRPIQLLRQVIGC